MAAGTRVSEVAGSRSVRGPASLDSAMRTLLWLEARDARSTGHFSREVLDGVLTNAHNSEDQQLLSDLFGFLSIGLIDEDERGALHDRRARAHERDIDVLHLALAGTARRLQGALDDVPEAVDAAGAQASAERIQR